MMGDPACEFTKACGMEMTHPGPPAVGIIGRCKRWAMYVENNVVKHVAVAEAEGGKFRPCLRLSNSFFSKVCLYEIVFLFTASFFAVLLLQTLPVMTTQPSPWHPLCSRLSSLSLFKPYERMTRQLAT